MEWRQLQEHLALSDAAIIYGAHRIAEDTFKVLHYYGSENRVCGFAVTDQKGNPSCLCGLPVKEIGGYTATDKKRTLIIVAMPEKFFSEVTQNLKKYGYEMICYVGGRQLACLENQEAADVINRHFPLFCAAQDPYEYLCLQLTLEDHRYRFMPLGAFPVSEQYLHRLASLKHLWEICGNPAELLTVRKQEELLSQTAEDNLCGRERTRFKIYAASSPKDSPLSENRPFMPWEVPVIGGASLTDLDVDTVCDNEGDNISSQNRRYAEMTVAYWAWKNSDADYIGLEHYRRRFRLSDRQIEEIVSRNIDAVLTRPRIVLPNIREWFARVSSLSENDIDSLAAWLSKKAPDDKESIQAFFNGNVLYPNNMVIAKKSVYGAYCQWLFHILTLFDHEAELTSIHKKNRCDAYIAELLTSLYFIRNRQGHRLAITDYCLLA